MLQWYKCGAAYDFFGFFSLFPVFCFIFSLSDASFHRRNVCGSIASCLPIFVRIKSSCLLSTMNRSAFQKVDYLGGRIEMCIHAGILHYVFFECLLEIEMIVPKINLIIGHSLPAVLAVCAQGLFCWCPLVVQRMPIRRSVRDHVVGTNFFNFPFA